MTKIYLIRHGESIANTLGIYQGQTYDTVLSPLGKRQVRTLQTYFAGKSIGAIYTSPLTRTRKTARHIALATGIPVQIDRHLLETNHGDWEGLPKAEIQLRWGDLLDAWNKDPQGVEFPGGETFVALQTRVLTWFRQQLLLKKDTVFVTHDNVIRVIIAYLKGIPFWDFPLDPAGVTIVEVNGKDARLVKLNDNRHLQDCLTNLKLHAL